MLHRFYSHRPITSDAVTLDGPEAHHLAHVLRARQGTEVILFDGSGWECRSRVSQVRRSEVDLEVTSRAQIDREIPFRLVLGVALPKGERQRWLTEKLVELGVTRMVPLQTARGVAQPVRQSLDRLQRAVIEASKQCGRNRLMQIAEACSLADYLGAAGGNADRWLAHPSGTRLDFHSAGGILSRPRDAAVHLAIGPEGGFTDEEVALARSSDWQIVSLGERVMRVETAALVLAGCLSLAASCS
jgi:16S rRNA (uracil1498-N3)-methyltransferase